MVFMKATDKVLLGQNKHFFRFQKRREERPHLCKGCLTGEMIESELFVGERERAAMKLPQRDLVKLYCLQPYCLQSYCLQ